MSERGTVEGLADLEELAAFVDGRLSGDRKARVEERLLRDEDYYEVFLETVRFQQEDGRREGRERGAAPVPISRWRSWRVAAPLAAAAVLAVAVGVLWPFRGLAGYLDAAAVVAHKDWDDPGWRRPRSGDACSACSPEEIALRLGAQTINLRVALKAGDRPAAQRAAGQSAALADAADIFTGLYEELGERLEVEELEALLEPAREAEELLAVSFGKGSPEARRFALGRWAEAGRLAALSEDARALRRIVRRDPGARSEAAIAPQVESLEDLVGRRDLGDEDFAAAGKAFWKILYDLAGRG